MKTQFFKLYILLLFIAVSISAQNLSLKLYEYTLNGNDFSKSKDGKFGFILSKPIKQAKEAIPFGFWMSSEVKTPFLSIVETATNKIMLSVSAKDFSEKTKMQTTGTKSTALFSSGSGAAAFEIIVEAQIVNLTSSPLGKNIEYDVRMKLSQTKEVKVIVNLQGDGFVQKIGTNGITASRVEKGVAQYPNILLVGNGKSTVTMVKDEKTFGGIVSITSSSLLLSSGTSQSVLNFSVNSSTVKEFEKSIAQAKNIETTLSQKKEITELAILNSASNTNPAPGDTVTFFIKYHNIGTALAKDIQISNPVPPSMVYVEESAKGENAEISYERKSVAAPQKSEITSITWKIKNSIAPGEEGQATMKAIVR